MSNMIFNMIKAAAPAHIQKAMDVAFSQTGQFDNSLEGVKQALAASNRTAQDIPGMLKAFGDSKLAPFINMVPGLQENVQSAAQSLMAEGDTQNQNQTTATQSVASLRDRLSKLS